MGDIENLASMGWMLVAEDESMLCDFENLEGTGWLLAPDECGPEALQDPAARAFAAAVVQAAGRPAGDTVAVRRTGSDVWAHPTVELAASMITTVQCSIAGTGLWLTVQAVTSTPGAPEVTYLSVDGLSLGQACAMARHLTGRPGTGHGPQTKLRTPAARASFGEQWPTLRDALSGALGDREPDQCRYPDPHASLVWPCAPGVHPLAHDVLGAEDRVCTVWGDPGDPISAETATLAAAVDGSSVEVLLSPISWDRSARLLAWLQAI